MIWWLACAGPVPSADTAAIATDPPVITSGSWDCSAEDDRWSFTVDTRFWTGNGSVLLSVDGVYVEEHGLRSTESAADGTADHLELELGIEADPRDASPGTSTAFLCDVSTREDLSGRFSVSAPGSSEEADCRQWGALDFTVLGLETCGSL